MRELRRIFNRFEENGNYTLDWKQVGSQEKGNRGTKFTFKNPAGEESHHVNHAGMPKALLKLVRKYRSAPSTPNKNEVESQVKSILGKL